MEQLDINEISKSKINNSAIILSDNKEHSAAEIDEALEIVNSWKTMHNYPLQVFKNRLKRVSEKIDKNALSAQRLKRISSIFKKLNRKYNDNCPTMKLTQMQDIAGCRVVMSDIKQVRELYETYYYNGDIKHKKVNVKDYISSPKLDGYRSIHLVYRYSSDKGKKEYNGLLVEVQIRSKLQHLWATAVETVDFFTRQAIKSNQGEENWKAFFKLVSSAFARLENTPIISQTPQNEKELYLQIKELEKKLQVKQKMKHWTESVKYFDNFKKKKNIQFYLLELDTVLERLNISAFTKREEKEALLAYSSAEKKIYNRNEYDVVLVSADNMQDLKKAYPNYFLDTKEFLKHLEIILNKY
ncbi:MAG: RelA/SpoT domain-containing protein [archaeon]|jgi:ppGpp synthetase/RelA/SpoT-type nucleotidyltranferase